MKNHTWTIFAVAAVLLLAGSFFYAHYASEQANQGVSFSPHVRGNPEAEVTLVEYSDFQCPACGAAYPVVEQIIADYGDRLKFEYKHFPLITVHPFAVPAAIAAEAAGQQGKFWEMHHKLFENQEVWSKSAAPSAYFEQYAKEIGLDMDRYEQHLNASKISDKVSAEFSEARSLGFTGTPSFTLNGEPVRFSTYQDLVDQVAAAVGGTTTATSTETASGAVKFGL